MATGQQLDEEFTTWAHYYRLRTKKWLEKKGYTVETLERVTRIVKPGTYRIIYIKRDIWASDLVAMNGEEIIFVNSVFGKSNVAAHVKEFLKYPYPPCVDRWVVVWAKKNSRKPEIVDVKEYSE